MPLLKGCSRCGMTLLLPSVRDGKCFCSPECEALYRDPDILKKLPTAGPAVVRKRAAILLVVSLVASGYLVCFPPAFAGRRWLSLSAFLVPAFFLVKLVRPRVPEHDLEMSAFLVPAFFLVELVTGKSVEHANLWYQSLPEWKRAVIMLGIMLGGFGALAGAVYLYVTLSPRF